MGTQLKDPQTFRVFFSSPFKGMEGEREELTRKYLPEIQHKCAEMGLQFVAVDMRWGISVESAQQAQTVNICFRELDRSDMLVCFFGQRYGWHGHTDGLLQENIDAALGKYPWLEEVRDRSVTELELRHGFLNNPGDMPAVVCFRDKQYDEVIRDNQKDKAANYTAEDEISTEKLTQLKQEVERNRAKALAVHMDYSNPLEGAKLIYEGIIQYLEDNVLRQSAELSRREKDMAPHKAFAVSHTSLYVANDHDDYSFLNESLASVTVDSNDSSMCPHVLVLGPAGSGKSALLSNWLQDHVSQQPDVIAIPYFIGCEPSTRDPEELLSFVYGELEYHLSSKRKEDTAQETGSPGNSKTTDDEQNMSARSESGTESKTDHDGANSEQATDQNDNITASQSDPANVINSSDGGSGKNGTDGQINDPLSSTSNQQPDNTDSEKKTGSSNQGSGSDASAGSGDNSKEGKATEKGDKSDGDSDKQKPKAESRPKGKELQHQVVKKLEQLVEKGRKIVLVFDGINRLVLANKTSKTLYWLPEKLAKGVVCVVSTDTTAQEGIDLLQAQRGYRVLHMKPLSAAAQQKICIQTLRRSGKELSQAQLDRIVKSKETENPLFLKIVLAELAIFGYFRKLDEKIDSLIRLSCIKELLDKTLERLESDYNPSSSEGNLVGKILKAIYVSQFGLTESEIISIFQIKSNEWSPLYFAMEYFIVSHLGNLGFAFPEVREAVEERYLRDPGAERKARAKLICYFDGIRKQLSPWAVSKKLMEKPVSHAVMELVWLQRKQDDRAGVIRSLTDLCVFRILNDERDLELLELWKWTGLKWSEVCSLLLKALDLAIVDCYLATEAGELDTDKSPGVRMRVAVSHLRAFFDLNNYLNGQEQILEREIGILENAEGKMTEVYRREYLRDARYYLACVYASQDRDLEAKALHESNMTEFERALDEKDDPEVRKQIAYTHNGLGIICMHTGEFDKGIVHLLKSTEFHNKNKDKKNEAAGYTNMALMYMYKREFETAQQYNNKALEAYEEGMFGQLSMDIGNVYTNIGLVYRRMKNLNKAEEAYLKSLQIKANAVGWDHLVISTAYMNLGTLEMHRSNYAKAEEWTRKAIAVYQANELAVTKKEYRRCRENLFANMLKQGKYEELLPFYIEIFDILHQNNWLDECLAGMHRKMVEYIIENKPDLSEKAEEISMALIDSPKAHPQNFCHLLVIDEHKERPYRYSLDACMEKFPTHAMYPTVVELKMEYFLLPKDDTQDMKALLRHVVANYTDSNFGDIISKVTTVAKEQNKEDVWFQCVKSMAEEKSTDKQVLRLFIHLCVYLDRANDASPFLTAFLDCHKENNGDFKPENIKPHRTRLDVGKILAAQGDTSKARQFLLLVTAKSLSRTEREEAKAALDALPGDIQEEDDSLVTSAA